MITRIENILKQYKDISQYQITETTTYSYEIYFVHKNAETIRTTTSTDYKVLIIQNFDDKIGTSTFVVQSYMSEDDIRQEIDKALVLCAKALCSPYTLTENEHSKNVINSNLDSFSKEELAKRVYDCFFKKREDEKATINALEIFIKNTFVHLVNSNGTDKEETRSNIFIESIPTYTIGNDSVELYKSYSFNSIDFDELTSEIDASLEDVKSRFYAKHPEKNISCKVIFIAQEIESILWDIAGQVNYGTIYSQSNVYKLNDDLQKDSNADKLNVTLTNKQNGVTLKTFDYYGSSFNPIQIVEDGVIKNYYGNVQYATYLNLPKTGNLPFIKLEPGSLKEEEIRSEPYLECASMSGIQINIAQNYIGGEVRLGYYFDGKTKTPISGISISGKLDEFLSSLKLSKETISVSSYEGPKIISGDHFIVM